MKSVNPKILLVHGLESGVMGKKAVYLRNHFGADNVVVPSMETGTLSLSKNSFMMHGIYNLGSLFSGKYQEQVAFSTLMSGRILWVCIIKLFTTK